MGGSVAFMVGRVIVIRTKMQSTRIGEAGDVLVDIRCCVVQCRRTRNVKTGARGSLCVYSVDALPATEARYPCRARVKIQSSFPF